MSVTIVSDAEDVESIKCTGPCNPSESGRSVIFVEIPVFNRSNSTMQKRILDSHIQGGYNHFVSQTYLFILKFSVIGCLFLLSFQLSSVMSSHMFCTRSYLFSHFSAFGLNLSHVTTTNTASLVMCGPVYSHYTH